MWAFLLGVSALKAVNFQPLITRHIFQYMGKIFCVEFQKGHWKLYIKQPAATVCIKNLDCYCVSPNSKITRKKMAMLGQFLWVPRNFEISRIG